MGKSPEVRLLFKRGSNTSGDQILLVYRQVNGGPLVISGQLRIDEVTDRYLQSLCKGRKPKFLTLEYDNDKLFRSNKSNA